MQKELNQIFFSTRRSLRPKLRKFPTLYRFLIILNRIYYSLTGFLHVLPDFYIIGTQKGGTGSLYDYLVNHPNVESCVSKEPSYFDRYYQRGINWYKSCFPFKFHKFLTTKIHKMKFLTGEASVRYLDHPYSPERLKKITPKAKFIVLLRNPIDRALSHHNRENRVKHDPYTFEEAILNEEERTKEDYNKMIKDENYFADSYFRFSYLKRGIYVDNLKRWMSVFPKEQFLILKSEDFFENPNKIYNQVLEFLKLPKFELKEYKIIAQMNKNKNIEPHLRKKLEDYFRPHNERLYKFLGVNYNWED